MEKLARATSEAVRPVSELGLRFAHLGFAFALIWSYDVQRIILGRYEDRFHVLFFIGVAVGCLLLFFLSRLLKKPISSHKAVITSCTVSSAAAAAVLAFAPLHDLPLVVGVFSVLSGMFIGWQYVLWGGFYATLDIGRAVVFLCVSQFISSVVGFVFSFSGLDVFGILAAISVLMLSVACWRLACKIPPDSSKGKNRFTKDGLSALQCAIFVFALYTFFLGALRVPFPSYQIAQMSVNLFSQILGIAFIALFLFMVYRQSSGLDFTKLLFILLIVLTLGMTMSNSSVEAARSLSSSLFSLAQNLVIIFLFLSLSDIAHNSDFPSDEVFGLGWSLYVGPFSLGMLFVSLFSLAPLGASACLAISSALICALFVVSQKRIPPQLRVFLELSPPDEAPQSPIEEQVERMGDRYCLSNREKEVIALYVQGRSRGYIAKVLFISENTVRDHIYNVYRKMRIHDKQELIDTLSEL